MPAALLVALVIDCGCVAAAAQKTVAVQMRDSVKIATFLDGYDTIEWIAKQPWCVGNVAMFGPSYWAATRWLAAANGDPGPPPHLKAIIPSVINPDFWERGYRPRGAMNLSMTAISRAFSSHQATHGN